ncbi:mannosyltransferase [Clarireedia jacksonii]
MLYQAPVPVNRRLTTVIFILLVGLLGLSLEYHYSYLGAHTLFPEYRHSKLPWSTPSSNFWATFAPLLAAGAPRCPPPQLDGKAYSSIRISARRAANHIVMNDTDIESMRRSHSWFVEQLKHQSPILEYADGTQGIVTSAGDKYFPPLIVSLQFLRRTGSNLPVEVFLATPDEYEPLVCETILPSLNAKCIVLSEIIDQHGLPFFFTGYQLKVFSILFSSFESVLFLDADNFPVHSPDELFLSEPFKSEHLILWPDYWSSTVSSVLNQVVGLDDSLLDNRPTIEAGQILVNKRHHADSLLLAAYYNCYGEYYYHLMTQGGPGEGDKETFAIAPLVLGKSFYTVAQPPRPLGQRHNGAAVLQADPIEDSTSDSERTPRPFFIHASWPPKLNALYNYQGSRQWGTEDQSIKMLNFDVERIAWGYMVEMACDEDIFFKSWGNKTEKGVCNQTKGSYTKMFGSEYETEQTITYK